MVDTFSPTIAVGRHHSPWAQSAIPGNDEDRPRGEREDLRERALITDQPGMRRIERLLRVVLRRPDRQVNEPVRD
jgi:hypothetical protein